MVSIADRLRHAHPLFWVCLLLSGVVIALMLVSASTATSWVGHTDLQGMFVVVDADTMVPIEGATVHFRAPDEGGGFCLEERDESRERAFSLTTDSVGKAGRRWTSCMCFGTDVGRKSTFHLHLPWLWYQVTAPGYSDTPWSYLDDRYYQGLVRRKPGVATLEVKVLLHRKPIGHASNGSGHDRPGAAR